MPSPRPCIHIINGPNLNLLGTRETSIYGNTTLKDVEDACRTLANELHLDICFTQANGEGQIIDAIHASAKSCHGIIINAGAYTHTSIAIMDALKAVALPVIEAHLSNIYKREAFRHHSYISGIADGVICGLGSNSYLLALRGMASLLAQS